MNEASELKAVTGDGRQMPSWREVSKFPLPGFCEHRRDP